MAKRKAEMLSQSPLASESKKTKHHNGESAPPKSTVMYDSDSESSDESGGGAKLDEPAFKINEEYAKRFEHNKKRAELHRLEEKYQKEPKPSRGQYGDKYDEDSESSDDEDEDDDGFLATEALDAEITATLQAIRSKDPRVYDDKVTFYTPIEEGVDDNSTSAPKQKPMYLSDYHRENLLKGNIGAEDEGETAPQTYVQEQEALKKSVVREMHAAVDNEVGSDGEDDDGDFLVAKSKPQLSDQGVHPSRKEKVTVDVSVADKDPETFLSNFLAARAWVPAEGSRFQPLESDDDDEDERADNFEAAYNLRFENPSGSNEVLKSYARDIIAAKSVRREEPNSRKKQRELDRQKKEAEKVERDEERGRLRRLKIEEMEGKLQKIKRAAGIRGKAIKDEDWAKFLDEGWDDDKWEAEMMKRFGDDYYAEEDIVSEDDDVEDGGKSKRKAKKPKWDDDIDITDLVPEFQAEEESHDKPAFTLSDSDDDGEEASTSKSGKEKRQERQDKKKAARLERKKIEELVDSHLDLDLPLKSKNAGGFRYRESSPVSFGLTARDILMASDSALNQFAGLKKMASFRDAEKKRKDKKNLGKKARLRQWRKETFGNEDEPDFAIAASAPAAEEAEDGVNIIEGKKKKKRSRKNKGTASADA